MINRSRTPDGHIKYRGYFSLDKYKADCKEKRANCSCWAKVVDGCAVDNDGRIVHDGGIFYSTPEWETKEKPGEVK